ncbi:lytic transglycosylase domain-containing protein [Tropicibacter oceani]|uniref:lytic transglycosylase domain-containing protein n=1 Tax=Tropicibacter oceani TaxID=3058420 RepID=UPI00293950FB|nr:lytic transglycosylase domain-containing protein [Tropicibacter oceani]
MNTSLRPVARRTVVIPPARWDKHGGKPSWSLAIVSSLRSHASVLPDTVPKDIANWCPAYPTASREAREAFWVGLVSALAKHESTYRPTAVGGGGLWYGLTQILPGTARGYGCKAKSGEALKDPEDNLSCAMRIMAVTVPRDQVISAGMRGVAADWGPFHSSKKREDMRQWTRQQPYCAGLSRSLRPVARPDGLQTPDPMQLYADVRPQMRPADVPVRSAADVPARPAPVLSTKGQGIAHSES